MTPGWREDGTAGRFLFAALLLTLICLAAGAQPSHRWTLYGGGDGADGAAGLAVSASGTLVVAVSREAEAEVLSLSPYGRILSASPSGSGGGFSAVVADAGARLWLVGWTDSPAFPYGLAGDSLPGGGDAFFLLLPPVLPPTSVTVLGGEGRDEATCFAVSPQETQYLCGRTTSFSGIATPNAVFTQYRGAGDGFVAAYGNGSRRWSSYLGGGAGDEIRAACTGPDGSLYVSGNTSSDDFPCEGGADTCKNGGVDAFLARFSGEGQLLWSTFFGGDGDESVERLAWDGDGLILLGDTNSSDLPTPGGYDPGHNGGRDLFVARWSPAGRLLWCSYFGGPGDETAADLLVEAPGVFRALATTNSTTLPSWIEPIGPGGMEDLLLCLFNETGVPLEGQRLGGSGSDRARAVGRDPRGRFFIAFDTQSTDWPRAYGGNHHFTAGWDYAVVGLWEGWAPDLFELGLYWRSQGMPLAPDLSGDGAVDEWDALELWRRWHK